MQKKNRKGFTLIELLAVIVILAIIALIAVPVIMNVITKARISAFEDSAYGIVKAGEMYYTNKLLDAEGMTKNEEFIVENDVFKNTENSDTLDLSGSIPSSGKVTVTSEGKVALVILNGEYCIQKSTSESKVKAVKQANCSDYKKTANPVFTTSTENASIPACITNNTECSAGTKVGVKVNASETYDFYVMSDNTEDNEITLLMSKSLGGSAWGSDANGPDIVLDYLEDETSNWTNIPSNTYTLSSSYHPTMTRTARARLVTYSEIFSLCGGEDSTDTFPSWLVVGWTSTSAGGGMAVYVSNLYENATNLQDMDSGALVHPVITISKTTI